MTAPRHRIEADRGPNALVSACVTLIAGGESDPALLAILGGPDAPRYLDAPPDQRCWLRVWGTRGLLWALGTPGAPAPTDPEIRKAILDTLADPRWRVREMGAKVVARHRVDETHPAITTLLTDETPRVRAAASRALRLLAT